jgi:hypothetical protein
MVKPIKVGLVAVVVLVAVIVVVLHFWLGTLIKK